MTPEQLQVIKDKHPGQKLFLLTADDVELVVRKPTRIEYKRFQSQILSKGEEFTFDAGEILLRACLVHPDHTQLDWLLEEYPGLLMSLVKSLGELIKVSQTVEKKAL